MNLPHVEAEDRKHPGEIVRVPESAPPKSFSLRKHPRSDHSLVKARGATHREDPGVSPVRRDFTRRLPSSNPIVPSVGPSSDNPSMTVHPVDATVTAPVPAPGIPVPGATSGSASPPSGGDAADAFTLAADATASVRTGLQPYLQPQATGKSPRQQHAFSDVVAAIQAMAKLALGRPDLAGAVNVAALGEGAAQLAAGLALENILTALLGDVKDTDRVEADALLARRPDDLSRRQSGGGDRQGRRPGHRAHGEALRARTARRDRGGGDGDHGPPRAQGRQQGRHGGGQGDRGRGEGNAHMPARRNAHHPAPTAPANK